MYPENIPHEDQYTPGTPVPTPDDPARSQVSGQPESEAFPEPITSNLTTPVITPHQSTNNNSPNHNFPNFESETAIDLDTPNDENGTEPDDTALVLSCHEISDFLHDDPIHEWNVFHPETETREICLAERWFTFSSRPIESS